MDTLEYKYKVAELLTQVKDKETKAIVRGLLDEIGVKNSEIETLKSKFELLDASVSKISLSLGIRRE